MPGRQPLASDLSLDGSSFAPTSGRVTFDASGPQTVTQLGAVSTTQLFDVTVVAGAAVVVNDDFEASGELILEGTLTTNGGLTVRGDFSGRDYCAMIGCWCGLASIRS